MATADAMADGMRCGSLVAETDDRVLLAARYAGTMPKTRPTANDTPKATTTEKRDTIVLMLGEPLDAEAEARRRR